MGKPLRVLIVEDSEDDAELLLRELRRGGYDITYERVLSVTTMRAALDQQTWDAVISDYVLPQFNGLDALNELQATGLDLPFIIVSGTIGEDIAVAAMKAGAHDYLMKGKLARLVPAIERELREAEERRERRRASEQLRKLSRAVEQSSTSIVITDTAGRIEYVNPKFTQVTGYTVEEVLGKNPRILKSGEMPPETYRRLWTTITGGDEWHGEFHNRKKNGELFWEYASISPITDATGIITHFVGVKEDITARKQSEATLQRQVQHLAALRAVDLAITTSFDVHVTLSLMLDQGLPALEAEAAAVLLFNPHLQTLDYLTTRGFRGAALTRQHLRLGEGLAGRVAMERRPVAITDLRSQMANWQSAGSPGQAALLQAEGLIAYYGIPLIAKGELKGVFEIFHRAPFLADADWGSFAETLAEQAAIAIDNAALFDNLQRSNIDLALAYDTTLEGWSRALDLRDKETEGHTQRVTKLTVLLGETLGLRETELAHIRRGALLHDIGKMGIPDAILLKPGPLTDEEMQIMRLHPGYAYQLLSPIAYLRPALDIPYCHHEKWDGTGYPRNLRGEQIPLAARIFAVVDVWDALCSDRPYRIAWSIDKVYAYLQEQKNKHFEGKMVDQLLKLSPQDLTP